MSVGPLASLAALPVWFVGRFKPRCITCVLDDEEVRYTYVL